MTDDLVRDLRAMGYIACVKAADELERLLAAALKDQHRELERLREENKFLRHLVANELRALGPKP